MAGIGRFHRETKRTKVFLRLPWSSWIPQGAILINGADRFRGSRFKVLHDWRMDNGTGHRTIDGKQRGPLLTRAISYLPYCRCDELSRVGQSFSSSPSFLRPPMLPLVQYQRAPAQILPFLLCYYYYYLFLLVRRSRVQLKEKNIFNLQRVLSILCKNDWKNLNQDSILLLNSNRDSWPRMFPRSEKWPSRGLIPEHGGSNSPWRRGLAWTGEIETSRGNWTGSGRNLSCRARFPRVYSVSWPRKWETLLVNANPCESTRRFFVATTRNLIRRSPEKSFFPEERRLFEASSSLSSSFYFGNSFVEALETRPEQNFSLSKYKLPVIFGFLFWKKCLVVHYKN